MTTEQQLPDSTPADSIDWSVLDAFRALQRPGSPDIRQRLITVYLDSSPALISAIKDALQGADGQGLTQAAHSLKSSSMSVGAVALGAFCADLEQRGKAGDLHDSDTLRRRLDILFAAVVVAFLQACATNSA